MWLDVNYLTRLPVFDIVLLFCWTSRWFNFIFGSETRLPRQRKNLTHIYSTVGKYKWTVWKCEENKENKELLKVKCESHFYFGVPQFGNTCSRGYYTKQTQSTLPLFPVALSSWVPEAWTYSTSPSVWRAWVLPPPLNLWSQWKTLTSRY